MNVPDSQREGKALKAFLAHRRAPLRRSDPTHDEEPTRLWERVFSELGGAVEAVATQVPEGTTQRVYWVDGSIVERISQDGKWEYSLLGTESLGPGSVHGGVLSLEEPVPLPDSCTSNGSASHVACASHVASCP